MMNCSDPSSAIYIRCDCSLPMWLCALANVCGYGSTVLWFLVLLPQVLRSWRKRSVEGVSPGWAIANFTAALNNSFFIFKIGNMPWYNYASAIYMPVLELMLLAQFAFFGKQLKKTKLIIGSLCSVVWTAMILAQCFFDVYREMEWVSIALWSAETLPQLFLDMQRQSTYGLANMMVTITAVGKTTDFLATYLLVMPLQYIVMAFFSSTIAQIETLQVIWYWKQRPIVENEEIVLLKKKISPTCHILRAFGLTVFAIEIVLFAVALIIRSQRGWMIAAPFATYSVVAAVYIHSRNWCPYNLYGKNIARAISHQQ